ncbi:gag-pol polyprotein [Tanacetum coccineum]
MICLAAIGERPAEVMDDSKWDEMEGNVIENLHLALAYGVLSSIEEKKSEGDLGSSCSILTSLSCKIEPQERAEILLQSLPNLYVHIIISLTSNVLLDYLVFDDVAVDILEEENRHNNREDGQNNTRHVEALVVTKGRLMKHGSSGSHNHGELVLMRGEKVGANLIQLKAEIMDEVEASVALYNLSHRVAITWHQKLRHMSEQGMKILVERKLLPGLTKVSLPFCEHYDISKQHCQKFKTSNSRSVSMELVHSDVWQAPIQSLGGAKYFVSFIDDYSRRYNRGEYIGVEFDTFCKQEGIKTQFTMAYTPKHNGVAERMNRTLLERARAMLETATLGKSFWVEAVNTACYVINCLPSTAIELKTPIEMWMGKPGYHLWDPTAYKVVVSRDVVFMEDKIQENKEVNEKNKSQALTTRTLNHERKRQWWDSDYVMESDVAYCLLTGEGEPSTLQKALNNPDASFWKATMQEEIEALHKNKTWELMSLL